MKISYLSDIHADFHVPFHKNQLKWKHRTKSFTQELITTDVGEKNVLIIAGDISHFNLQSFWIIEEFANTYEQVYYCFGNHDFYLETKNQDRKYRGHSLNRMQELLQITSALKNVMPLIGFEKHYITDEITIAGDTFWYPLKTLKQISFFYEVSNDSKLIKRLNIGLEHNYSISNYDRLNDATIIVTHVPPITSKFHMLNNLKACYLTPVRELKGEHWIFGHIHEQSILQRPYGNFYVNAMGYKNEWKNQVQREDLIFLEDWDVLKNEWYSIKHFEI